MQLHLLVGYPSVTANACPFALYLGTCADEIQRVRDASLASGQFASVEQITVPRGIMSFADEAAIASFKPQPTAIDLLNAEITGLKILLEETQKANAGLIREGVELLEKVTAERTAHQDSMDKLCDDHKQLHDAYLNQDEMIKSLNGELVSVKAELGDAKGALAGMTSGDAANTTAAAANTLGEGNDPKPTTPKKKGAAGT